MVTPIGYDLVRPTPWDPEMPPLGSHLRKSKVDFVVSNADFRPGILASGESGRLATTLPTKEIVADLVAKLKAGELRQMSEEIINAAILACDMDATEHLCTTLSSWLATAEVTIDSRRRLRSILKAREESRNRLRGLS